jgi:8-oxo-dGTP diphosphatase
LQQVLVVAAIIERADGRFLVGRRAAHKASAGLWEFPGGKPELGESEPAALEREIFEELGVAVRVLRLFDRSVTEVAGVAIELACYACELVGAEPAASTDHDELRWVSHGELAGLEWAEPDLPAVKRITMPFC